MVDAQCSPWLDHAGRRCSFDAPADRGADQVLLFVLVWGLMPLDPPRDQALDGLEVLNRSGRLARLTLGLRVTEPRQEQVEVIPLIQAHLRLALRFSPEPGANRWPTSTQAAFCAAPRRDRPDPPPGLLHPSRRPTAADPAQARALPAN